MIDFNAPPRFGIGEALNVTLEYGIQLGSDAIDLMPLDFRSGLYVTHDEKEHPRNAILLFVVFSDACKFMFYIIYVPFSKANN